MKIILRWKDQNDKENSKEYTDYRLAVMARSYLVRNGATDVDMAMVVKKKPTDA